MLGGIALARLTAAFAQEAMRCMGMLMPFAQGDPEALIRIKTSNREEIMTIHRTFVAPHRGGFACRLCFLVPVVDPTDPVEILSRTY